MSILTIQRKVQIPMIGTWKWKKEDYEIPLIFPLNGAKGYLYLDPFEPGKSDREIVWDALLQIILSPVPSKFVRGLKSKSAQAKEVADKVYSYYTNVFEKFESISRTAGNVKNLMADLRTSYDEFFKDGGPFTEKVTWWVDDESPKVFTPTQKRDRRRINTLFKKEQIITKEKWKKMQEAINNGEFPSEELLELLRIRSKLEWRQKKMATIESAIFVETILRDYGERVLLSLGLSKNKLKSLRDEMSFNTILNIVLPLTLTKTETTKVDKHLKAIDLLRRVRNDVVHGNITEKEIDEIKVRNGIEGSLVLVEFLRKKLS